MQTTIQLDSIGIEAVKLFLLRSNTSTLTMETDGGPRTIGALQSMRLEGDNLVADIVIRPSFKQLFDSLQKDQRTYSVGAVTRQLGNLPSIARYVYTPPSYIAEE